MVLCGAVMFCLKDALFEVVLAPKSSDFVSYKLLESLVGPLSEFDVSLINVNLAQQFMIHLKVALWAGALCVSPYILYVMFGYVAPALYEKERKYAIAAVGCGYFMFVTGVLLNYFVIFPLTFRFLGTYQVSQDVVNMISLESYVGTLGMLCLVMGVVFEMPVLCWLLGKMGVLSAKMMQKARRYAIVAIVAISAIITPSGDAFTLIVVSLPIYLLYELSVCVLKINDNKKLNI